MADLSSSRLVRSFAEPRLRTSLRGAAILAILLALAFSAWLETISLAGASARDPDEGVYLMAGKLLNLGYPYSTFFFDQPVLFPQIVALGQRIAGDSILSGRLTIVVLSLAGLFMLALVTRGMGWPAVAPLAVLFAAANPVFLQQSRYTLAEVPSAAFLLIALVAALAYRRRAESGARLGQAALLISGACFAASVLIKPLTLGFGLTILAWIADVALLREGERTKVSWGPLLLDLALWSGAGLLVALLTINPLNLQTEIQQTVGFHLQESSYYMERLGSPAVGLLNFARLNLPWLGLIVVGVGAGVVRAPRLALPLVLGESALIGTLLLLPPFDHHYALLVPVLALFAALGVQTSFELITRFLQPRDTRDLRRPFALAVVSLLSLLLLVSELPRLVETDGNIIAHQKVAQQQVTDWFIRHLRPGAFYVSEDAFSVYAAGALVPPSALNLTYPSTFRVYPQWSSQLEATWRDYPVRALVTTGEYVKNAELRAWIEERFSPYPDADGEAAKLRIQMYVRK